MRYLIVLLTMINMLSWAADFPEETFVDEYDASEKVAGDSFSRITFAENNTWLTREQGERGDAIRNMPVSSGDFLETGPGAYAEVAFIDGSLMQFDNRSVVEFQAINQTYNGESLSIVKLHKGSVLLHVSGLSGDGVSRVFRLDTIAGSGYFQEAGIYHVLLEGSRMKVKVFRGFAELSGEEGSVPIYSGEYSTIRGLRHPTTAFAFNSFHTNKFERWATSRRPTTSSVSEGYVDESISSYAHDLDEYGEWRYADGVSNYVWVPYVGMDWRPYNSGFWDWCDGAMTWVSYDPFGWVTHHYGRWGWNTSFGWYWIPGRWYSPAWVAWSSYDRYLGWCPLGYSNRPYYYGINGGRNTVIINNHRNTWVYVDSTTIVNRDRNYVVRNVDHRGSRRITTRNIYVSRDDLRSADGLRRVVRNPEVNRERAAAVRRTTRSSTIVRASSSSDIKRERVAITSRSTGTRAGSRIQTTRTTVRPEEKPRSTIRSPRSGRYYTPRDQQSGASRSSNNSNSTAGSTSRGRSDAAAPQRSAPPRRATVPNRSTNTNRSGATQSTGRPSNNSATRPARSNRTPSATRSGTINRNRSSATSGSNRSRSTVTRPSNSSRSRSSATRSSGSNRSSATRSSGSNRSSATRSSSSRSSSKSSSSRSSRKKDN
jgi:hypothetical protein